MATTKALAIREVICRLVPDLNFWLIEVAEYAHDESVRVSWRVNGVWFDHILHRLPNPTYYVDRMFVREDLDSLRVKAKINKCL